LLPKIDAQFRELDSQRRLRMEQREHLARRLQDILTAPRPELLATADERIDLNRIRALRAALQRADGPDRAALQMRLERLQGVLTWRLYTEYPERLTRAHEHLRELNQDVEVLQARYDAFVRARQAAVHSYMGYDQSIRGLRTRVSASLDHVNTL